MNESLTILIFLPSFAMAFAVLAAFYDTRKAYLALCWVPIVSLLFFILLGQFSGASYTPSRLPERMIVTIVWISLVQFLLGIGLVLYGVWKKQNVIGVGLASIVAVIPFVWSML